MSSLRQNLQAQSSRTGRIRNCTATARTIARCMTFELSGFDIAAFVASTLAEDLGEGLPNLLAVPRVVCFIGDPDRPLETPAEILQRLFGLTAGEARLAERLKRLRAEMSRRPSPGSAVPRSQLTRPRVEPEQPSWWWQR